MSRTIQKLSDLSHHRREDGRKLIGGLSMLAVMTLFSQSTSGGSIVGSRHDLSDPIGTNEVCIFCHAPHSTNANISGLPLWNRALTESTFTLYGSPTMNTTPGQPGTAMTYPGVTTRLCLSCHDGVNAYVMVNGNLVSTKHDLVVGPGGSIPDMSSWPNCERCHADFYGGRKKLSLGTNLSNDHPVSIPYPTAAQDPDFHAPPDTAKGWGGSSPNDVKLFGGSVECTSCHNPHDPGSGSFLRKSNAGSAVCLTCHVK